MSKIAKKTSLFVKFLYGSLFFTLAGYIASVMPSIFAKDYTNVAPKLVETAHADTITITTTCYTTSKGESTCGGSGSGSSYDSDGSCDTGDAGDGSCF